LTPGRPPVDTWQNHGRPQLSAHPLGGEIHILRRLLYAQVLWSGLLTVVALNVTFTGPWSVAFPLFLVLYFLASVGARYGMRPFLVCALAQLLVLWLASLGILVTLLRSALALDFHRDARPASIALGIYLVLMVIPATLLVWGFWRHRPQVVAALQQKTLAA
jgi:hypothetical protein